MKTLAPQDLNRLYHRHPFPVAGMLELTSRCHLACRHCIRDQKHEAEEELSTAEWRHVLDELADLKGLVAVFTGGEPTMREDLAELTAHARGLGLAVSLKTNGARLADRLSELVAAGLQALEISIYGATAAAHEECTQEKGSFAATLGGIEAARGAGLPVTLKFFVFEWNVTELESARRLAERLGCPISRDLFLIRTDAGRDLDALRLAPAQARAVETSWPQATLENNQNRAARPLVCTQGINNCAVTATGDILSCIQFRKPLGNARREGLANTWRRFAGRMHGLDYNCFTRCARCPLLPRCRVCVGQNHAATGDPYEPPPSRCLLTMALYGQESLNRG